MPEMEITAGAKRSPLKNLSASTITTWQQDVKPKCLFRTRPEMDNINELKPEHRCNDTFGLYLKRTTYCSRNTNFYYGYPLQKFSRDDRSEHQVS